jgi:hypothetical protein
MYTRRRRRRRRRTRWTASSHLKHLIKRHSFAEFRSLDLARFYAERCTKAHWVVQGDLDDDGENGRFWVVLPADAARLEAAGYEIV